MYSPLCSVGSMLCPSTRKFSTANRMISTISSVNVIVSTTSRIRWYRLSSFCPCFKGPPTSPGQEEAIRMQVESCHAVGAPQPSKVRSTHMAHSGLRVVLDGYRGHGNQFHQ